MGDSKGAANFDSAVTANEAASKLLVLFENNSQYEKNDRQIRVHREYEYIEEYEYNKEYKS